MGNRNGECGKTPLGLRLGPPIGQEALYSIQRALQLHHCKWDAQVGDVSILNRQPLIIDASQWGYLCESAEKLAAETYELELACLERQDLLSDLGIPEQLAPFLSPKYFHEDRGRSNVRILRFDFHPTAEGWKVSEVNSDVPGGLGEATFLPHLFQRHFNDVTTPAAPLTAWGDAIEAGFDGKAVAFLSAPGYLEDFQVISVMMNELTSRRIRCIPIQTPASLVWTHGEARFIFDSCPIGAVVRFYQAEWISRLPRNTGWKHLFKPTSCVITNPAPSIISESKRLPLVWHQLARRSLLWTRFAPACRDISDIKEGEKDDWVLKATFSNTGDGVRLGELHSAGQWQKLIRFAKRAPLCWVAQKRFQTMPLDSLNGPLYPCVGVFVINQHAAGAYVRLSTHQVTDMFASESPMLINEGI